MQEIPYSLDIDFAPRSNADESSLIRQGICKRCWQNIFDASQYAQMWLDGCNRAYFVLSLGDLGISTQNGCTWCRLLKTHGDDLMRCWAVRDPEACLLLTTNIRQCHDSRITPTDSLDLEVTIEISLSSRAVRPRSSRDAQDKDLNEY